MVHCHGQSFFLQDLLQWSLAVFWQAPNFISSRDMGLRVNGCSILSQLSDVRWVVAVFLWVCAQWRGISQQILCLVIKSLHYLVQPILALYVIGCDQKHGPLFWFRTIVSVLCGEWQPSWLFFTVDNLYKYDNSTKSLGIPGIPFAIGVYIKYWWYILAVVK